MVWGWNLPLVCTIHLPASQEQLMLQCTCSLLLIWCQQLPSAHSRYVCSSRATNLSVEKHSLTRVFVSLFCNEIILPSTKSLLWFGCVPQKPYVWHPDPSVTLLRDGIFKGVIRSSWCCPQGWIMWLPWKWVPYHKNDCVRSTLDCFPSYSFFSTFLVFSSFCSAVIDKPKLELFNHSLLWEVITTLF